MCLLRDAEFAAVVGDEEASADELLAGDAADISAVRAVVAVVSHHEEVSFGHGDGQSVEGVVHGFVDVGFVLFFAVEEELSVLYLHLVAGEGDDAFHEGVGGVFGVAPVVGEYDDVAAGGVFYAVEEELVAVVGDARHAAV